MNTYRKEKENKMPEKKWILTSEKQPTSKDADESGTVWVYNKTFGNVCSIHISFAETVGAEKYYIAWMPKEKRKAPDVPLFSNTVDV